MYIDFGPWEKATGELDWGAQKVIHDALVLVSEGKVTNMVYGADYANGGACLVNTVGQMLAVGGGSGIPSQHFGDMVREFDLLNRLLFDKGVNTKAGKLSPYAAEILVYHFGELKPEPEHTNKQMEPEAMPGPIIPEVSDEELAASWTAAMFTDAVSEDEVREVADPVKELDYAEGPDYADYSYYDAPEK